MDVTESFVWLFVVCLLPGSHAGDYCRDMGRYCDYGCCYDSSHIVIKGACCSGIRTTYSPISDSVVESTVNLAVIIGASVGGFLLLVVIVSVVLCIICCTKTNRGQVGHVVQGQTMVVAGSYPMQTTNMQPGINTWQPQQPYHINQNPNLEPGASQWQNPPYSTAGEGQDNNKRSQQPPADYP